MSDPAVLLDRDLGMVAHSASYPTLAGFRRRQLINAIRDGASTFDFVGGNPDEAKKVALACMANRKAMHFAEETVSNQNGDELTVILSYLPILSGDEAIGVIQSFRDVSAEARMQGRYRNLLVRERMRAENLEQEVEKRTRELSLALEEVTRLSRVDPLTGLLNRRAFTELAEQAMKVAKRHGRSIGLLLGDIDFFKKVNDEYGHMIGDRILASTAKAMGDAVRDSDAVARFGGEEFVVLLTETERDAVPTVGERVRRMVSEIRNTEGPESDWPKPTISLGQPRNGGFPRPW
ncbi:MAG: GGDEF domain-containing protein [Myxococcales bacterium]|nr:GGDEF domain-containing protein [Myxococcales bacterium]